MGFKSWEVTDAFWSRVEPLIPAKREHDPEKVFIRKPGGGCKRCEKLERSFVALNHLAAG